MNNFMKVVEKLKEIHGRIAVDRIEAGRIISDFIAELKHGQKLPQLRKLCKSAGISLKTAYNYKEAFEESKKLGKPIIEAAEKAGLAVNKKSVRDRLAEVTVLNPQAGPAEIVKFTKSQLQPRHTSEHAEPEELSPKERQEKLFGFAEKLYWNVAPATRERELKELADKLLDHFRLDDPEAEVA